MGGGGGSNGSTCETAEAADVHARAHTHTDAKTHTWYTLAALRQTGKKLRSLGASLYFVEMFYLFLITLLYSYVYTVYIISLYN